MHFIGPVHTAMGAIAYLSALVYFKKTLGREVPFIQGYEKNPVNWSRIGPKFGWYGKVSQKSGRFAKVTSHSRVNRKGRSTFRICWVSTGTRISLTKLVNLSQYIRETLFSCRCFLIFRNKLPILISVSPKTLFFFNFITDVSFSFINHKLSPFQR